MAPINRAGPPVVGELPSVRPLTPPEVEAVLTAGAALVDTRDRAAFAESHVAGSVNVELGGSFSAYVGWLFTPEQPLVLVVADPAESSAERAATQLFRIGFDQVRGYLAGGMDAWRADGRPTSSYPVASVEELCHKVQDGSRPFILDVRQPVEHREGMFPGSTGVFLPDLPRGMGRIPADRESWVICASGLRASTAASLLDAAGRPVRLVAERGVTDLLAECSPDG
jgi:rhodanese-related sulfurtransferase